MTETRIVKEVTYLEFKEIIDQEKHKIRVNAHAYFRLSQMQRKIYKDETLIEILTEEKPVFIGLQANKNYAAFFRRKQGYLRMVFVVTTKDIGIITFYLTDHIPTV